MAKAKASGGDEAMDGASFTTDMDALYRDVLNDDERIRMVSGCKFVDEVRLA